MVAFPFIYCSLILLLVTLNNEAQSFNTARRSKLKVHSVFQLQKDNEIHVSEPMQNITKRKGERALFLCDIIGRPIPAFQWYKNDLHHVNMGAEDSRIKIKQELWGSSLRIDNLQESDAGKYTCMGTNPDGSVNTTAFLTVDSQKYGNNENLFPKTSFEQQTNHPAIEQGKNATGLIKDGICEPFRADNVCKKYLNNKWVFVADKQRQVELESDMTALIQEALASMSEQPSHYCFAMLMKRLCLYHLPECRHGVQSKTPQIDSLLSFQVFPLCESSCTPPLPITCAHMENIVRQLIDRKYFRLAYDCKYLPRENCQLLEGEWSAQGITPAPASDLMMNTTSTVIQSPLKQFRSLIVSVVALAILLSIVSILLCVWCLFQGHCHHHRRVFTSNRALRRNCLCLVWPCACTHYQSIKKYTMNLGYRRTDGGGNAKNKFAIFRCFCKGQPISHVKVNSPASSHPTIHTAELEPLCCFTDHAVVCESDKKHAKEFPLSQIRLGEILGQGKFGPIYYGELFSESCVTPVIVKAHFRHTPPVDSAVHAGVDVDQEVSKAFQLEANCHTNLNHCNVLSMLGVSLRQNPQCMLYERTFHCDLHEFLLLHNKTRSSPSLGSGEDDHHFWPLTSLGTDHALHHNAQLCLASQIATGLHYLHSFGIVHRDVAARNILLSERLQCKISDLGAAREKYSSDYLVLVATSSTSPSNSTRCIPVRWSAPEVTFQGEYSFATDIWSFGVVLWELWSYGERPYGGYSNEELLHQLRHGHLILDKPDTCGYEEIYHMMLDCWMEARHKRPTSKALIHRLGEMKDDALLTSVSPYRVDSGVAGTVSHPIPTPLMMTTTATSTPGHQRDAVMAPERGIRVPASIPPVYESFSLCSTSSPVNSQSFSKSPAIPIRPLSSARLSGQNHPLMPAPPPSMQPTKSPFHTPNHHLQPNNGGGMMTRI